MKRILVVMAVALLVSGAAMAESITATTSPHNLSSTGPGGTYDTTEVCVFCHTPHQPTGESQDPLWNHTASVAGNYGVYSSSTMAATPTEVSGSGSASVLCMSCHDGTVAVGSMLKGPTVTLTPGGNVNAAGLITGDPLVGTDLTNDHPVNFDYSVSVAAKPGDFNDPPANAKLFAGSLQCASCHNPHDNVNGDFLVIPNASSALCTDCHVK